MNSVLESSYAWTGQFVEAINRLTCDVASLIFGSLSLTSNNSGSSSNEANESPVVVAATGTSGEAVLSNIPFFLEEIASLFTFDDFQLLLLKIFVACLVSNICLIYIAWYFYGAKITERFMNPNNSPEELQKRVAQLKLPKVHSQRYS